MKNPRVAKALGVHAGTVSSWRGDAFPPSEENIEQLAKLLGVTASWLRYGEGGDGGPGRPQVRERPSVEPASFAEHVLVTSGRIAELADQIARAAERQLAFTQDLGRQAQESGGVGGVSLQRASEALERAGRSPKETKASGRGARRKTG